jgi:FlaA1/EpsC-like NDP-sugar epimerase
VHEVANLILQVAVLAETGNVYVLDVGEEIKIADLAERMIRSKGLEPGKDMEIVFTGLRPGEKLKDDLLGEGERLAPTSHGRVFQADGPGRVAEEELVRRIAETEMHLARGPEALAAELHKLARIDLPTGRTTPTTSNSPS